MNGTNAGEVFGKLDTNKDGALTLEEFRVDGVNTLYPDTEELRQKVNELITALRR